MTVQCYSIHDESSIVCYPIHEEAPAVFPMPEDKSAVFPIHEEIPAVFISEIDDNTNSRHLYKYEIYCMNNICYGIIVILKIIVNLFGNKNYC